MKTLLHILETLEVPARDAKMFAEDCITTDSGHLVYWPEKVKGYLDEHYLLLIAAYLYQKNKPWDEQIERDLSQL